MVEKITFKREGLLKRLLGIGEEKPYDNRGNLIEPSSLVWCGTCTLFPGEKPEETAKLFGGGHALYQTRGITQKRISVFCPREHYREKPRANNLCLIL